MNRKEFIEKCHNRQSGRTKTTSIVVPVTLIEQTTIKEKAKKANLNVADFVRSRIFYDE